MNNQCSCQAVALPCTDLPRWKSCKNDDPPLKEGEDGKKIDDIGNSESDDEQGECDEEHTDDEGIDDN